MINFRSFFQNCLLLVLLFGGTVKVHSQGISVSPVKFYFNLHAGESKTQKLKVSNLSSESKIYEISISDWERDSLGTKIYYPPGTLGNSCSNWLIITPALFELGPNETYEVNVQLARPVDGDGATIAKNNKVKCSMLFIKEVKEKTGLEPPAKHVEAKMIIEYRLGVHVYQNPSTAGFKNVEIMGLKLDVQQLENRKKEKRFALALSNTGDMLSESMVRVEMTNTKTGEERKIDPVTVSMMPETKRTVFIKIPDDLPRGEYSIVTIVDNGPDYELKIAELEITF